MATKTTQKSRAEVNAREVETEGKPSASGFDSEIRCLGKRGICGQVPGMTTKYATRGTNIHTALETNDLSTLTKSDAVTAERIMFGEAELINSLGYEGAEMHAEQRLWFADEEMVPVWSGKMDVIHHLRRERRAMCLNYKTGYGDVVPIEHNWQIAAEAVLTWQAYDCVTVDAGLIHPHHPETLYQTRRFEAAELATLAATLTGYARIIYAKTDLQRTPNAISCRFCDAKWACPEYKERQEETKRNIAAARDGQALAILMDKTPAERGEIVRETKALGKDIEEFILQCKEMISKDPDSIAGYCLRPGWLRLITDDAVAMEIVKDTWGVDGMAAASKFDLGGVERYLNETCKMSKNDAKKKVNLVLKAVIQWKPKDPSLEIKRN